MIKRLPDAEFEVMKVIWKNTPPITTLQIIENLGPDKNWKPQTVLTMLARLVEKGFLKSDRVGKERSYSPAIQEQNYMQIETSDFMNMIDKMLVMGAIEFTNRKVSDIMTKKSNIISVKSSDMVGPKLLDELHQSGHMVFPVMKAKNIVGMLHVEDVATFDQGEKMVTDVMRRVPVNINKDATLEETLVRMKDDHSFQLLATNDEGELVGLIDICDIVDVLLGRKTD